MPEQPPPQDLVGFYWYFAHQARALFLLLFGAGLTVALLDLLIPVYDDLDAANAALLAAPSA